MASDRRVHDRYDERCVRHHRDCIAGRRCIPCSEAATLDELWAGHPLLAEVDRLRAHPDAARAVCDRLSNDDSAPLDERRGLAIRRAASEVLAALDCPADDTEEQQ